MSILGAFRCTAFTVIVSSLGAVAPTSVGAQAYTGLDCTNPDFFQDCKYYSDVYGYASPNYAVPYYAYGLPVAAGVIVGMVPRLPFFHRRHPSLRSRGDAVHNR